jgi:hypothetical protein
VDDDNEGAMQITIRLKLFNYRNRFWKLYMVTYRGAVVSLHKLPEPICVIEVSHHG